MRFIPIRKPVDEAWIRKSDLLIESLYKAPSAEARKAIIDSNRGHWGELRIWLLKLSHEKCWFSEAKDCFSHWDVEHYRPKSAAKDNDGTTWEGYWWLAFDWRNLRICGNVGNRKKGAYFPLRSGSVRTQSGGDLRYEDPELLDPANQEDPLLLSFTVEGEAVCAPWVHDEWERTRVAKTIARYRLDFGPLADKRKVIWSECWNLITLYLDDLNSYQKDKTNAVAKQQYLSALQRLRAMLAPDQELSAVARACIESTGDPRLIGILRTS